MVRLQQLGCTSRLYTELCQLSFDQNSVVASGMWADWGRGSGAEWGVWGDGGGREVGVDGGRGVGEWCRGKCEGWYSEGLSDLSYTN